MKKLITTLIIPFLLIACSDSNKTSTEKNSEQVKNGSSPVSEQEKIKQAYLDAKKLSSFSTGSMMSANQVYVLFDPQCPHCGRLWNEAKKINSVNFYWIPVGFLNPKSTQQGAALIASSESAKLMNVHEELLSNNSGGMVTNNVPQAAIDKIKINTEFFKKNFQSVPVILFQNNITKEFGVINGAVPKEVIESKLG